MRRRDCRRAAWRAVREVGEWVMGARRAFKDSSGVAVGLPLDVKGSEGEESEVESEAEASKTDSSLTERKGKGVDCSTMARTSSVRSDCELNERQLVARF